MAIATPCERIDRDLPQIRAGDVRKKGKNRTTLREFPQSSRKFLQKRRENLLPEEVRKRNALELDGVRAVDAGFDRAGDVDDVIRGVERGVRQEGQQRGIRDQGAVAGDFDSLVVAAVESKVVGAADDEGLAVFLVDSSGNIGDDRATSSAR